jgi:hypothetical protein
MGQGMGLQGQSYTIPTMQVEWKTYALMWMSSLPSQKHIQDFSF